MTLLRRLADGDPEALERLLQAHLPALRGYVRLHSDKLLRAKEASTDLVQSVCLEILRHADRFQYPTEGAFRQWLYATALRKIRQRYRYYTAQKREAAREARLPEDSSQELRGAYQSFASPADAAEAREEVERIERAFDQLPEDYRTVLVQARIVGLSRAEIAEQMERSEGAVRTLLSRAQAKLADLLDPE